jgi:type I restriction enzyme S subunit
MKRGEIPKSWTIRPLADCGQWVSGGTPRKSEPSYWNGHIPWFSAKSLKTFDLDDAEDRVTNAGAQNGTTLVPPGTILFVVRGMSLANEFRVGVTSRESTLNQDLRGIIVSDDVLPRYLGRFLKHSSEILSMVDNASHGTKRLQTDKLKAIEVPLPPLSEQKRIANILDKADAIRRKRLEAQELYQNLLPAAFVNLFGQPARNQKKWPVHKLGKFIEFLTSGSRGWARYYVPRGKRFIRSLDVQMNHIGSAEPVYVDSPQGAEADRTRVQCGDVLLTITGSKIGRVAFVPEGFGEGYVSQHVAIVRLKKGIRPRYCSMFLSLPDGGQRLIARAQYGQTKPGLSLTNIQNFEIPCPPLDEQDRFLAVWDEYDRLGQRVVNACNVANDQFASLVQRAFQGRL